MNNRICAVIATATLLTLLSGCSGLRNRLFGRGARCGLCSRLSGPTSASCGPAPCEPQQPCNQNAAPAPYTSAGQCGSCGQTYGAADGLAYGGGCGCNQSAADPYLSTWSNGSTPYDGQIINYGVTGDGVVVGNGTTYSDGFVPRIDAQGNQILGEQPLPAGGVPVH